MTHCSSWSIDQSHKFHNAPAPYPTVHYSERECAHLCSEWYTAECGTGAFSDLWIWSITSLTTTALVHAAAATTTATATATTATATATTTITIITTTTSSTTTHYYYYYFCYYCCQVSNIKRTKSPNFNVSCLVSQLSLLNPLKPTAYAHALKRKCRHFDNFQCSQWWKFHQNEDISVSVRELVETDTDDYIKTTHNTYPSSVESIAKGFVVPWRNPSSNYRMLPRNLLVKKPPKNRSDWEK